MNLKREHNEFSITWQMWVVIFATAFGVYLGGFTSGWMVASAHHDAVQAKTLTQVDRKIDQLPTKTAEAVKEGDVK